MNNCNLEKFNVKPGKISPKFTNEITNYYVILGITENKTILDFFTEDSGASYQILVEGGDGSKTIQMAEGSQKVVKIEVTAEDGKSTKNYFINIKRHSSKIAIIEALSISEGQLIPPFDSDVLSYCSNIGLDLLSVAINIQLPDKNCDVLVNKNTPQANYFLTMGLTVFSIDVSSPDKSNRKIYTISMQKKYNPYYIFIPNNQNRLLYEDAISLSPCFTPIKTNEPYSWDLVSHNEAKQLTNLERNTLPYTIKINEEMENILSDFDGQLLKENFVLTSTKKIRELGSAMVSGETKETFSNISYSFYPFNDTINLIPEWQNSFITDDYKIIEKDVPQTSEDAIKIYLTSRPLKPIFNEDQTISNESPSKKLSYAISFTSKAILQKKDQSKFHFMLAQLLEENYLLTDLYNVKQLKNNSFEEAEKKSFTVAGQNNKAVFSSKQDEILAICRLHGFTGNPTDTEQLKAIDLEYHSLISQNQSTRADNIQNLFEWKSKQTTLEGMVSSEVKKEGTLIGQAFNKYLAALSLDKKSYLYNFHVGRLLIVQGKYKDATERFHTALSCNNKHNPSKFCLGLALSFLPDIGKSSDAAFLIFDGFGKSFQNLLKEFINDVSFSETQRKLLMDEEHFFNLRNPLLSKGLLQLGKLLLKTPQEKIESKPLLIIHWALHLAVGGWMNIGQGSTQINFESTIIECHKQLLIMIEEEMENMPDNICSNRCLWLLNFIRSSSVKKTEDIIQLQEEISKVPLFFEPGNDQFLAFYGEVLSLKADQMIVKEETFKSTIETAIKVLHLALDVKKKKKVDEAIKFIESQSWYKRRELIIFKSKPPTDNLKSIEKKPGVTPKALPVSVKPPTSKTQVNSTPKKAAPTPKKGPIKQTGKDKDSNIEKIVTKIDEGIKVNSEKSSGLSEKQENHIKRCLAIGLKTETYGIELLLGRAYCIDNQFYEGAMYYKMCGIERNLTNLNDLVQEYIDVLIAAGEPLLALNIYFKLPINEKNPSFDDGYICGEIVRLMMKTEKYTDKNLIKYASLWAKIFGFAILEKEIKQLEDKNHNDVCKEIYASVHGKKVDDADLQIFFQSKCWI